MDEHLRPPREYDTPVYKETLAHAVAIFSKVPILAQFNRQNCLQSHLNISAVKNQSVLFGDEAVYKIYTFKDFIENQNRQIEFFNEMTVTKEAKAQKINNIIHFQGLYMGRDHIAIKPRRMQITFRGWLMRYRVPRQINEIILQAIHGVRQLNDIGYIH